MAFVIAGIAFEVLDRERKDASTLLGFLILMVALAWARQSLAPSLIERTTIRLRLRAVALGLVPSVLTAVLFGVTRGDWPLAMVAGLTLAIALLPEELPLVWDLCLALGAGRLARRELLLRRPDALEQLAATTMLCASRAIFATPEGLAACRDAGVRALALTTEPPPTEEETQGAGEMQAWGRALSADELERLTPAELSRELGEARWVCGMGVPETLRLLERLTASGERIAVVGERVEDVPLLQAAHIGIALGTRGSELARQAAGAILVGEQSAVAIVAARQAARQTLDNFRASVALIIGVHVPMAGLAILPAILGWKMVLLPAHVLLVELVVVPACALVFAAERGPGSGPGPSPLRAIAPNVRVPLYDRATLTLGLLRGGVICAVVVLAHEIAMLGRTGEHLARVATFVALVVASAGLTHERRSSANPWPWRVTIAIGLLLAALLYVPELRERFAFGVPAPGPAPVALGVIAGALAAGLLDAVAQRRDARAQRTVTRA